MVKTKQTVYSYVVVSSYAWTETQGKLIFTALVYGDIYRGTEYCKIWTQPV